MAPPRRLRSGPARGLVWCAALLVMASCAGEPPLNVVLISVDTLRRDHLGVYGYGPPTSPHIDGLARQGVVFDSAIAVHTNTAPSHASMMTGLYPGSHGIRRNGMTLRPGVTTLAERLSERGYATAAFVSGWTLHPMTGLAEGFDVYDFALREMGRRAAPYTWGAARRWLTRDRPGDDPFFLFFHLFDPHYPYTPPVESLERFLAEGREPLERLYKPGLLSEMELSDEDRLEYVARYDAEIALADETVGELLAALDEEGLTDRTVVIFTSDHGETLFERPWVLDHGGRAYDEQLRVPMILRLADATHAGERVSAPVSHVDILPTVAELLGIGLGEDGLSGRSLLSLLGRTDSSRPRPTFSHARPEPRRVPEIEAPLTQRGLITAIRLPGVKLVEYPVGEDEFYQQLFMLDVDPGETSNVAAEHAELVDTLHRQLEAFRHDTDSGTRPPLPRFDPEVEAQLRALGYVE